MRTGVATRPVSKILWALFESSLVQFVVINKTLNNGKLLKHEMQYTDPAIDAVQTEM